VQLKIDAESVALLPKLVVKGVECEDRLGLLDVGIVAGFDITDFESIKRLRQVTELGLKETRPPAPRKNLWSLLLG
jgi:hypothetical protein